MFWILLKVKYFFHPTSETVLHFKWQFTIRVSPVTHEWCRQFALLQRTTFHWIGVSHTFSTVSGVRLLFWILSQSNILCTRALKLYYAEIAVHMPHVPKFIKVENFPPTTLDPVPSTVDFSLWGQGSYAAKNVSWADPRHFVTLLSLIKTNG